MGRGVHVAPEEDGRGPAGRPGAPPPARWWSRALLSRSAAMPTRPAPWRGVRGNVVTQLGGSVEPAAEIHSSGKEGSGLRE